MPAGFRQQLVQATVTVQGSRWGALAWERAYSLQHENRRQDYVSALGQLIDWTDVESRFARA